MASTPNPRPSTPSVSQAHPAGDAQNSSPPSSPDPLAIPVQRFSSLTGRRTPGFGIPAVLKPTAASPAVTPNKAVRRRSMGKVVREGRKLDGMKVDVGMKSEGERKWIGGIVFTSNSNGEREGNGKGWRVKINVEAEREGTEDMENQGGRAKGGRSKPRASAKPRSRGRTDSVIDLEGSMEGQESLVVKAPKKVSTSAKQASVKKMTPKKAMATRRGLATKTTTTTAPFGTLTDSEEEVEKIGDETPKVKTIASTPKTDIVNKKTPKTKRLRKTEGSQILGRKNGVIEAEPPRIDDEREQATVEIPQMGFESQNDNHKGLGEDNVLTVGASSPIPKPHQRRITGISCAAESASTSSDTLKVPKHRSNTTRASNVTVTERNFSNISHASNLSLATLTPPASSSPDRSVEPAQIQEEAVRANSIDSIRSFLGEIDRRSVNSRSNSVASSRACSIVVNRERERKRDSGDDEVDWISFSNGGTTGVPRRKKGKEKEVDFEREKENTITTDSSYSLPEHQLNSNESSDNEYIRSLNRGIDLENAEKQFDKLLPPSPDTAGERALTSFNQKRPVLTTLLSPNLVGETSSVRGEAHPSLRSTVTSVSNEARAAKIRERWARIGRTGSKDTSKLSDCSQEISLLPTEKGRKPPEVVIPVKKLTEKRIMKSRDNPAMEVSSGFYLRSYLSEISNPPETPPPSALPCGGVQNPLLPAAPNVKEAYLKVAHSAQWDRPTPEISHTRRASLSLQEALGLGSVSSGLGFGEELPPTLAQAAPPVSAPSQPGFPIGEIIMNSLSNLMGNPSNVITEQPVVEAQAEAEQSLSISSSDRGGNDTEDSRKARGKGKERALNMSTISNTPSSELSRSSTSGFSPHKQLWMDMTLQPTKPENLAYPNLLKQTEPSPVISRQNLNMLSKPAEANTKKAMNTSQSGNENTPTNFLSQPKADSNTKSVGRSSISSMAVQSSRFTGILNAAKKDVGLSARPQRLPPQPTLAASATLGRYQEGTSSTSSASVMTSSTSRRSQDSPVQITDMKFGSDIRIYSDKTLENMFAAERAEVIRKATRGEVSVIVIEDTNTGNSTHISPRQEGRFEEGDTTIFMEDLNERVMKGLREGKGGILSSTPHVRKFFGGESVGKARLPPSQVKKTNATSTPFDTSGAAAVATHPSVRSSNFQSGNLQGTKLSERNTGSPNYHHANLIFDSDSVDPRSTATSARNFVVGRKKTSEILPESFYRATTGATRKEVESNFYRESGSVEVVDVPEKPVEFVGSGEEERSFGEEESITQGLIEQDKATLVGVQISEKGGEKYSQVSIVSGEGEEGAVDSQSEELNEDQDDESTRVNLSSGGIEDTEIDEEGLIQAQLLKESQDRKYREVEDQIIPASFASNVHKLSIDLNWDKTEVQHKGPSRETKSKTIGATGSKPQQNARKPADKSEQITEISYSDDIRKQLLGSYSHGQPSPNAVAPMQTVKFTISDSHTPQLTRNSRVTFPLMKGPTPEPVYLRAAYDAASTSVQASPSYTSSTTQTSRLIANPVWTDEHWAHVRALLKTYCLITPSYQALLDTRVAAFEKGNQWEESKEYYYALWRPSWNFRKERCWELEERENIVVRKFLEERKESWNELWQGMEKEVGQRIIIATVAGERRRRARARAAGIV